MQFVGIDAREERARNKKRMMRGAFCFAFVLLAQSRLRRDRRLQALLNTETLCASASPWQTAL